MAKTTVVGFPRIGAERELKFWTEDYFLGKLTFRELSEKAAGLRKKHWLLQREAGLDFIPSNDFSFYDGMLDTAFLFGAVPRRCTELGLSGAEAYFAAARGYQGQKGDVKALPMKKWFNTNYHFLVPQLDDATRLEPAGSKPFGEYREAEALGIRTRPVLIGPFTFLKLSEYRGSKKAEDYAEDLSAAYRTILLRFSELGAEWVQFDEPSLVTDLSGSDLALFERLYSGILPGKRDVKVLLQTYFGDLRDLYEKAVSMDFDAFGIDFAEGKKSAELIKKYGFPENKLLFAGVVNGRNIWRNDYGKTLALLGDLPVPEDRVVLSTSCSLLHVPYTVKSETVLPDRYKRHFAFAEEKLAELSQLRKLFASPDAANSAEFLSNAEIIRSRKENSDPSVRARIESLSERDFTRRPAFSEREKIQKKALNLPILPTTTIGSFPQTKEIKALRAKFRKGEITKERYEAGIREKIASCVRLQESIGLDVLVHGEFERNDMVEYFGDNLSGFLFTRKGWVQSYGTRCVKPPIIWSDVRRTKPITVETIAYAQSLTQKPVKGMLTGPVTILNWSFPREDISGRETAFQIALAIREEVLDLEKAGIRIIQIDEAALKEKLPLRRADWHSDYLDWAIPAFRLVHSGVKPETQIHTHMCYSEFGDIVGDIDNMDADVISFEASRSDLAIVDDLNRVHFRTEVGPGVYDIHSPRVPSEKEIEEELYAMLKKLPAVKLWVNPDCGLKTRGEKETEPSLRNLVSAAAAVRASLK